MDTIRKESDSMGSIDIPADRYYGAQTARSLIHFSIGEDRLPRAMIRALGILKKSAASVHQQTGDLSEEKAEAIIAASQEVIEGKFDTEFPLRIWQTGSGTQSNMNANEVIANRALELLGKDRGDKRTLHPNDHVNLSQSSNDTFPSAMHIAAVEEIEHRLLPALKKMQGALRKKAEEFSSIVKIGRTHLMDAVPISLGQEFSGYVAQIEDALQRIDFCLKGLYRLPIGGTAVGTGLNAREGFDEAMVQEIVKETGLPFLCAKNKFSLIAAHDDLVFAGGALRTLAVSLTKIANDIAWMSSGPGAGLHELIIPANEPGSSIMPGKVNPTQCEALNMVCAQVFGNDAAISFAGSQGNFELNVFKPVIIRNFLHSVTLLADGCNGFTDFVLTGLKANEKRIENYLHKSIMPVTALTPEIGYDKAALLAKTAMEKDLSLREANALLGIMEEEEFLRLTDPVKLIRPKPS